MIESKGAGHWLTNVVRAAGHADLDVEIPAGATIGEVWTRVAGAAGLSEDDLATLVAKRFRLDVASIDEAESRTLKLLPEAMARRYHMFPLREDDRRIVLATSDPTGVDAEQAIGFVSGRTPVFEVATPSQIATAIDAHYSPTRFLADLLQRMDVTASESVSVVSEVQEQEEIVDADAGPVIKLTNLILRDAVTQHASDIHIEPGRGVGIIRFRVDGVLRKYTQIPMPALIRVASRIKILGQLDIADRIRPQDGRAQIRVDETPFDLRISTVPTLSAEKIVIRILGSTTAASVADLGLAPPELERFRRALSARDGIVIVTGPTGSGKTTTLYAAVRDLATDEVNVMTVEDPIEYELPGITQIQVEPKRNVTFGSALRAILRQDPDIILVGEIRDLETAQTAVQAANTGHLVLATLHTNDAASVIQRLIDIGLDRPAIAGSLRAALAQRLVRRPCTACGATGRSTDGSECGPCGGSGYHGRMPVVEVMLNTPAVERHVASGAPLQELERVAIESGMRPMHEVARESVRAGNTTAEEVERVLGEFGAMSAQPIFADEPWAQAPVTPVRAVSEPHTLVVDDDPVNRMLARTLLERAGHTVVEAPDGMEALDHLRGAPECELVVLDLDMPRMNGAETLRRIRASVATAMLPVIVLTGTQDENAEIQLMEMGADDYIRKPMDAARFVARVKAALRRANVA